MKTNGISSISHSTNQTRGDDPIRAVAYTNAKWVEIFLNGTSLGKREIERHGHGEWELSFTPGRIEVKAYVGETLVATDARETTERSPSTHRQTDWRAQH